MKKLYGPIQEIKCFIDSIDSIIGQLYQNLMCQRINLFSTDEYKLFYYIKENIKADISYFFNLFFEEDSMGFIPVKRNIRISSEALLDLYNLVNVNEYKTVLQYMDDRSNYRFSEKFKKYCCNGNFTIQSKLNIAKDNGFGNELDSLENGLLNETNKYIHASIFVQPNNFDFDLKLNDAKYFLQLELSIYQKALRVLCGKYNFNIEKFTCQYQTLERSCVSPTSFEQVYIDCRKRIQYMDFIDQQNPYIYAM